MMKIILFLFLYLSTLFCQEESEFPAHLTAVKFDFGITFMHTSEADNQFGELVKYYQDRGIPMEVQTLYPFNSLIGGGFSYYLNRSLSLSLSAEYSKTKAFSLYSDFAGNIDLKSEISFISGSIGLQNDFKNIFILEPFLGLNIGIVDANFKESINILFYEIPEGSDNYEWSFSGVGLFTKMYGGLSYDLNFVNLGLSAGYQYYLIPKPEKGTGGTPFKLSSEGYFINVYLSRALWKM